MRERRMTCLAIFTANPIPTMNPITNLITNPVLISHPVDNPIPNPPYHITSHNISSHHITPPPITSPPPPSVMMTKFHQDEGVTAAGLGLFGPVDVGQSVLWWDYGQVQDDEDDDY